MITKLASTNLIVWYCPGCKGVHMIRYGEGQWTWNMDRDKPTFHPSVLVTYSGFDEDKPIKEICHSFVRDGNMQFLNDCTHELAGQTVPIPEWPWTPEQYHIP